MTWLLSFLATKIGKAVSAVLAGAVFVFGLIQYGKISERNAQRVDDLEDFVETTKKVQDVKHSPDRAAAIERLRRGGIIR